MKTVIYYFTGTGNSLAAAQRIAARLGDTALIGIPALRDTAQVIPPPAHRIGVVCPVHGFAVPGIVAEFIERLDLESVEYAFLILTYAGMTGAALSSARRVFRQAGKDLDFGAAVRMPSNDIALSDVQPANKQGKILAAAEARLEKIAQEIAAGATRRSRATPIGWALTATVGLLLARHRHTMDRKLAVNNACDGCGICAQVCPADNITIADGRPRWHHRCEICLACVNYCPQRAIQYGNRTARRGRYHHPEITAVDLAAQKSATWNEFPSA